MVRFIRTTDGRILDATGTEAQHIPAEQLMGPTATFGIVQFAADWQHPATGRQYHVGEFEKFDTTDPATATLLADLAAAEIIHRPE